MKTTIYLVRHGETIYNQTGIMQGWADSPLTAKGVRQAQAAGQYFRDRKIEFAAGYVSPLSRTQQTFTAITNGQLAYHEAEGLKERSYGFFDGKGVTLPRILSKLYPGDFYAVTGGESDQAVSKRMYQALEQIAQKETGKTVLVVSHGNSMRDFFQKVGVDMNVIKQHHGFSNCSIFKVVYQTGKFELDDIATPAFSVR